MCKRQQRGNFLYRRLSLHDFWFSLRLSFLLETRRRDMPFIDSSLVSVSSIAISIDRDDVVEFSEWQKYPESRKQMLWAELFLSQFQITAIIFFLCLATAATNFLFLLNSTRNVWRNVHHVQMNVEQCVCFLSSLFPPPKQKMFLTACVHIRVEIKLKIFVRLFFKKKNKRKGEVIKLIMCCVLKNTLRQVDAKRKETKLDVRGEFYFFCTFRCGALRGWRRSKLLSVGNAWRFCTEFLELRLISNLNWNSSQGCQVIISTKHLLNSART